MMSTPKLPHSTSADRSTKGSSVSTSAAAGWLVLNCLRRRPRPMQND